MLRLEPATPLSLVAGSRASLSTLKAGGWGERGDWILRGRWGLIFDGGDKWRLG